MKAILLSLVILLSGCAHQVTTIDNRKPNAPHPMPIAPYKSEWLIEDVGGQPFVGMQYSDFLQYQMWNNDVVRYIKDMQSLVCYYEDCEKPNESDKQDK